MANPDAPFGFKPVRNGSGAPYNGAANLYMATCGTNLFVGDPVLITGEANNAEIDGHPPGSVPIVNVVGTANTSAVSGVIVGVVPQSQTSTTYYAGTKTDTLVWVCDDPYATFEVQMDAAAATVGVVGMATSTIADTAGSTVTGKSGYEVDADVATQGVWVVERFAPRPDNDAKDTGNAIVWVTCRKHTRNQSGGRGITGLGLGIS